MLGDLKDCLVIDTEMGANFIAGSIANVSNLDEIRDLVAELVKRKFKYIAIDTINPVIEWLEQPVLAKYGAKYKDKYASIGEIPHFAGWEITVKAYRPLLTPLKGFVIV